jgi:hypothetical protein
MLTFRNSLSVHICARTDESRERWAGVFGRLFGNFTRTDGRGGWVGEKYVETEPVIIITCWTSDEFPTWKRFLRYARLFQTVEKQEAVGLQITADGKWTGLVVFESDWQEVAGVLEQTFDRGTWLANYFCDLRDGAEGPDGCDTSDHHWQ